MALDYTVDDMIQGIKDAITIPTSQPLYLPDKLARVLDKELRYKVTPLVMRMQQEFFVHDDDHESPTSLSFEIPERAVGGKLRDVVLVSSNGFEADVERLDPDYLKQGDYVPDPRNFGYYFKNSKVIFFPPTISVLGQTVRLKYFRRPSRLIVKSKAGQILSINTVTKELTLSTVPTFWTTSLRYDFIKGTPPQFQSLGDNKVISSIAGSVVTMSAALPDDLAVGDWVAEAGFSPIAQIPYETHGILIQRAVVRVAEALKDASGKALANETLVELMDDYATALTPRADGSPEIINTAESIFDFTSAQRWWT